MPALIVRMTRSSTAQQGLDLRRADGSQVAVESEARSLLLHDLVHLAVESEAGLDGGFFGRIARGADDGATVDPDTAPSRGDLDPAAFVARLCAYLASSGEAVPHWFDEPTATSPRACAREGLWRATRFGEVLELHLGGPIKPVRRA